LTICFDLKFFNPTVRYELVQSITVKSNWTIRYVRMRFTFLISGFS